MRCFGDFLDDRTCDLCKVTNIKIHTDCKLKKEKTLNFHKTLHIIKTNCPYRKGCWDECNYFDGCIKDGYFGKHTEECRPTLECKKHCKGEQLI